MSTLVQRIEAAAGAPPLSELSPEDRAELERELRQANDLEDLPGRWQAAVLAAESGGTPSGGRCH